VYSIIEHTADLGITATGTTLNQAFEEVARGMFAIMTNDGRIENRVKKTVTIEGTGDLELLVVGTTIHDITGFVAEHVAAIEGIKETGTILIMKTYKENGQMYFDRKEGERLPYSF